MPSAAQTLAGDYRIVADAFNGGTYLFSSAPIAVRIANNNTPISQAFGPVSGSSNVNQATPSNASYYDEDGSADIVECAIELRRGTVATQAFYNRVENKLYLSDGNGNRIGGFAPLSNNVISNSLVSLNCAQTDIYLSGTKQLQVRWNFTPKTPLIGTNDVNLDVTDRAGAHAGFINKATWAVIGPPSGNVAPVALAFGPGNGSSAVGNLYKTNSFYVDDNGISDLKYLIVAIKRGALETRAFYDATRNLLYLQNDAGQYVGGVVPGTSAVISNSLVTLDCSQTNIYLAPNVNQIQVRWHFIAQAGLLGVNDIYMLAFDMATASSGFTKAATWTVYSAAAAKSSGGTDTSAKSSPASPSEAEAKTYSAEDPYVGEVVSDGKARQLPTKNTSDGTAGPPYVAIPAGEVSAGSNDSSASSVQQSAPSGQAS